MRIASRLALAAVALAGTAAGAQPIAIAPTEPLVALGKHLGGGLAVATVGQTFLAPPGASTLTGYGLQLGGGTAGASLTVSTFLYALGPGDAISGDALFSATLAGNPSSAFDAYVRRGVTTSVALTPGARYVALYTVSPSFGALPSIATNAVGVNGDDAYAGGSLVYADNGADLAALLRPGALVSGGRYDLAFDATFTSTVPEPTSMALVGAGLLLLAVGERRRRRR
jgi:hypothetical protein